MPSIETGVRKFEHVAFVPVPANVPLVTYTLELSEYAEGNAQTTIYGPDYKDPFVNEICEFYDCIASSRKPKTSLQDSLEDLELFQKIIGILKKSESI